MPQNRWGISGGLLSRGRSLALAALLLIISAFSVDYCISHSNHGSGKLLSLVEAPALGVISRPEASRTDAVVANNQLKTNQRSVDTNDPPEGLTCEDWLLKAD